MLGPKVSTNKSAKDSNKPVRSYGLLGKSAKVLWWKRRGLLSEAHETSGVPPPEHSAATNVAGIAGRFGRA